MLKKNKYNKKLHIFLCCISTIIFILLILNIVFIKEYFTKEQIIKEEVLYTQTEEPYDENKKYYSNLSYNNFKKIYKSNKVTTIAVIDNSSKTYNKFIELINKVSFYKSTKIQLLETSKLSRKNEIAFYNLDERLKKLETNYIMTVSNNKILSITTFEEAELNKIIESLGE